MSGKLTRQMTVPEFEALFPGFRSLLNRGIIGSFHKVCAKYLRLDVAAFTWRYNNRSSPDIFGAAVARC